MGNLAEMSDREKVGFLLEALDDAAFALRIRGYDKEASRYINYVREMRDEVEQAQENARLIADAETVFHTTGLTPSQLVERVKELEGALRKISAIEDQMYGPDWEEIEEARGIADAALSKARPNTAEGAQATEAESASKQGGA